ncbi:MAG: hypothetical protein IVW55_13710 [Chloroflexi bacterium]|nr:hypothetical protein [Chloroflexota bacterium]
MTSTIDREREEAATREQPGIVAYVATEAHREHSGDSWLSLTAIVLLGGISGVAYYLGFVQPYQLGDYYNKPLMDLAKINGHTSTAANGWAFTWLALFACYYFAFRLCPRSDNVSTTFKRVALFLICGYAAFFSITLISMYPVGAADIFDQIFRARLLSHYHLNPFTTLPNNIQGDPFQPFVAWKGDASPYGPLWELLAGGTSALAGNNLLTNLILFKLLVVAAYGGCVALTYSILRVSRPDWALRGTLFFAWNPLVLFEIAGNGHNDAIVVFFLLLAVYLFVLARRTAVIPALMLGALTKFVPIVLLPVAAAAIWRDRTRRMAASDDVATEQLPIKKFDPFSTLAVGSVIALGLGVVLYAPFWQGPSTVGALSRQALFTASIPKVALDALVADAGIGELTAQGLVRNSALALVVAVVVVMSLRVLLGGEAHTQDERRLLVARTLAGFYEVIFFYLAFATLWFQPWYLIWLIALTAPLARYTNANRTLLFCVGGVANYFIWDFVWLWNRAPSREIQIMAALAVYTLPLLYTLYLWLRPLWEGKAGGVISAPALSAGDMT